MMLEDKRYYHYWGKTNRSQDSASDEYHLLPYHSLDVAACGYIFIQQNCFQARNILAELALEQPEALLWLPYFLALHDIGKFARGFQQLYPHRHPELVPPINGKSYICRHDSLGYWLWNETVKSRWFAGEASLLPHADNPKQVQHAIDIWMQIVTGHHGAPPNILGNGSLAFAEEDKSAACDYLQDITPFLAPATFPEQFTDKQWRKKCKSVSWPLAGIAILADWLGSHQRYFPLLSKPMPLQAYWHQIALPRAKAAVSHLPVPARVAPFSGVTSLFPFIRHLTPLQQKALEHPISSSGPSLYILEDVTGAGKTEAAFILGHRLMAAGKAQGIYMGLPTMATANAMYQRLADVYRGLYQTQTRPSLILSHGARQLSEKFTHSIWQGENHGQASYGADESSGGAQCNIWFADSRKKALLADIGVGTLDQALMSVLPFRHQSLRVLGLQNKLLILDEVHAYDAYMSKLLEKLLHWHASQGGSAIVLTATLPYSLRQKLTRAFNLGAGRDLPELDRQADYPWWTSLDAEGCTQEKLLTRKEVERSVAINWLTERQQGIEIIKQAVSAGRCIAWVINSVDDAIAVYQQLRQVDWLPPQDLLLFHSRFAFTDRLAIEEKTLTWFGNRTISIEQRRGKVLIATQVIEQSLNIDLDILITDLAPIDLLIQRAGRLQRHIRHADGRLKQAEVPSPYQDERPAPVLHILAPQWQPEPERDWISGELRNSGYVYANHALLWKTQYILRQQGAIRMPNEARLLVESVYEDCIPTPTALEFKESDAQGKEYSQRAVAEQVSLKFEAGYSHTGSTHWYDDMEISTRLGETSLDVYLAREERDGTLIPYSDDANFPWEMSRLQVREGWWKNYQEG